MDCYLAEAVPDSEHSGAQLRELGEKDGHSVWECPDCSLVQVQHEDVDEYNTIYKDTDSYFHHAVIHGHESYQARFKHDVKVSEVRVRNLDFRMNGSVTRRLLDVGCGNGAFVNRASKARFDCLGLDICQYFIKCAVEQMPEQRFNCRDLIKQDNEDLGLFDVVTFHDSFEHFLDPVAYLKAIKPNLREQTLIVVELPCTNSDDFESEGMAWRHVKPREHPFLYNEEHIEMLFGVIGRKVIDIVYTIPGRVIYYIQ